MSKRYGAGVVDLCLPVEYAGVVGPDRGTFGPFSYGSRRIGMGLEAAMVKSVFRSERSSR